MMWREGTGSRALEGRWTLAAAALLATSLVAIAILLGSRGTSDGPARQTALGLPGGSPFEGPGESVGPVAHDFRIRLDSLQDAVAATPQDVEARLALARTLHDAHRLPEAIAHYEILVAGQSELTGVHFDLARAHAQLAHWDEAATIMEALLETDPENAAILYNLGAISANRGDSATASQWWTRMLDLPGASVFDERARASLEQLEHGRRERS